MYDLGLRIKKIRTQRGLTQSALARKINKSISAISSYETNSQMPPLDVLLSIASALNVSLDQLVGFDTDASISVRGLTDQQKRIIDMILAEFTCPSSTSSELSAQQLQILQQLILIFSGRKSETIRPYTPFSPMGR